MKGSRVRFVVATAVAAVAAFGWTPPGAAAGGKLSVGDKAPAWELTDWVNAPRPYTLAQLAGKGVLLEFWASWCGPCRMSVPHLLDIEKKFAPKGLVMIGVSDEGPEVIQKYGEEHEIPYALARDAGGKLAKTYGVSGIPHAVLISPQGKIVWQGHPGKWEGFDGELTDKDIGKALAGSTPGPPQVLPKKIAEADVLMWKGDFAKAAHLLSDATAGGKLDEAETAAATETLALIEQRGQSELAGSLKRKEAGEDYAALLALQSVQKRFGHLPAGVKAGETAQAMLGDAALQPELDGGKKMVDAGRTLEKKQYRQAFDAYTAIGNAYPGSRVAERAKKAAFQIKDDGLYSYNPKCKSCRELGKACSNCDKGK